MLLSSNPLTNQNEYKVNRNDESVNKQVVIKVRDVIGEALPRIGAYKQLDNKKQVVALIDDVIYFLIHFIYQFFQYTQKF